MSRVTSILAGSFLGVAMLATAAPAQAQAGASADNRDQNLSAYVELLRSDLRTQKVAIITEVMGLSEAEDAKFWPIYRDYENKLAKINDERMAMIMKYAASYDTLTDATADSLAKTALDLEAKRGALLAEVYENVKKSLSPKQAVRFLQVEHQILLLLDLQISSALPVVQ